MTAVRVGLVGAAGETGTSIVDGLLEAGDFELVALTRSASVPKPGNKALKQRGVEVRPVDLQGPQEKLVGALQGIDIVVSAIRSIGSAQPDRFGHCTEVGRCEEKEVVYNHIKQLYLCYTILGMGWWYQIAFPRLPSGKIDYAISIPTGEIPGDGNAPSSLTDLCDISKYVATIITDDRTRNKMVLAYNETWSLNQVFDLLEQLSGEKLERKYISESELRTRIASAEDALKTDPHNFDLHVQQVGSEYMISWGIRGDNTPAYAKYLGYVTSKALYPDMKFTAFEEHLPKVVEGRAKGVYGNRKDR